MKRTTLLLTITLLSCLLVSGQTQRDLELEKGVAPHAGIDDIYRRFSEGYRKLDAASVANLYTSDASYLAPGAAIVKGRQKILDDFTRFFNSVKSKGGALAISFRIVDRRVSKDLAYDVGIFTLVQKNGEQTSSIQGKFVVVARKMEKGDWQFHVDSYSDLPQTPSSAILSTHPLRAISDAHN